jgi:hypothetical protein
MLFYTVTNIYIGCLVSCSSLRQLSQHVPAHVEFPCDKAAVVADMIELTPLLHHVYAEMGRVQSLVGIFLCTVRGELPWSKEPATGRCCAADQSRALLSSHFCTVRFNIVFLYAFVVKVFFTQVFWTHLCIQLSHARVPFTVSYDSARFRHSNNGDGGLRWCSG